MVPAIIHQSGISQARVLTHQFPHETSRRKVTLQESDEVSSGKKESTTENDDCWLESNSFVERVETCSWQDQSTDVGDVGQEIDCKGNAGSSAITYQKSGGGFPWLLTILRIPVAAVQSQIWVIHRP